MVAYAVGRLFAVFAALSLPYTSAESISLSRRHAVKEYHPAPRAWKNLGRAPGNHIIDLSIGLVQNNFDRLERQLYEVSDPQHHRYGQYLTNDEIHELVKPAKQTSEAVHDWLAEHGIQSYHISYTPAKDWLKISLPVSVVERLLDTEYSVWQHTDGSVLVRTETWSLPRYLHDLIQAIQPTNSWARTNPNAKRMELEKRKSFHLDASGAVPSTELPAPGEIGKACNFSATTPNCLRTLYGTLDYTPQSKDKSRMGLTNYLEEYNNRSDTKIFLQKYRPDAAESAYEFQYVQFANGTVDTGVNTADESFAGEEGNLDVQYMLGIAWPLKLTAYSTGGRNPTFIPSVNTPDNSDEPFLVWVNSVLEQNPSDVPQIISTSYGDDEQTMSRSYAIAVCRQFAQLSARGVTLLFSSGDAGVGDSGTCISNQDNSTQFLPTFPGGCPYVTMVGGTYQYPEVASFLRFRDGSIFASGAGFSNYFDKPDYQNDVVSSYVRGLNGQHDGLYNKSGRAYPDIACVGQIFPIIWNGTADRILGTSGSSPICAAVLALVNDALIASGKPVLGFLNPWLYGGGYKAFTDVTNGSSIGCDTQGFPAKAGWDAVTGFGTPFFPKILKALGIESHGGGGGGGGGGYGSGGGYVNGSSNGGSTGNYGGGSNGSVCRRGRHVR